jgi:hypothetical protein
MAAGFYRLGLDHYDESHYKASVRVNRCKGYDKALRGGLLGCFLIIPRHPVLRIFINL